MILLLSLLQFEELEGLGYVGFSLVFLEEKSHIAGTSSVMKCFSPQLIEYLHAVIVAGKFTIFIMPEKFKLTVSEIISAYLLLYTYMYIASFWDVHVSLMIIFPLIRGSLKVSLCCPHCF